MVVQDFSFHMTFRSETSKVAVWSDLTTESFESKKARGHRPIAVVPERATILTHDQERRTAMDPNVERIVVDPRNNRLILELDRPPRVTGETRATLDIGALGRLIGIEFAGAYVAIADPVPGSELLSRSVEVTVEIETDPPRVAISRHGPTWELSFPSGNQCWNRTDGEGGRRSVCSVLIGT